MIFERGMSNLLFYSRCRRSLWQVRLSFVRFCHFRGPRFTMIIRTHRRALYHHPVNHTNTVTQSILSSPPLLQTHPHHYFVSGSISSCFLRLVAFVNRTPARAVTWCLTTHALHGHRGDSGSRLPERYVFKGVIFWGGLRTMRNWRFVHSLLPSERHVFVYLFSTNVSSLCWKLLIHFLLQCGFLSGLNSCNRIIFRSSNSNLLTFKLPVYRGLNSLSEKYATL